MVWLLHATVTCYNLISERDFRESSSLWRTAEGNEKMRVSRRVRPFLKCLEPGIQGCTSEGAALSLTGRDGRCSPRSSSHLSHVYCSGRKKKSLLTNKSPPKQLTAVGWCISKSIVFFVESEAALPSEAGNN